MANVSLLQLGHLSTLKFRSSFDVLIGAVSCNRETFRVYRPRCNDDFQKFHKSHSLVFPHIEVETLVLAPSALVDYICIKSFSIEMVHLESKEQWLSITIILQIFPNTRRTSWTFIANVVFMLEEFPDAYRV